MPEENVATQPTESTQASVQEKSPFDDANWTSTPPETLASETQQQTAPPTEESPSGVPPKEPEEVVVDVNEWLKENFGMESVDTVKAEWERLRKLQDQAQTPAEIQFANEESKKFFDILKEGKEDDLYNVLHQKKTIDRLEKMELTSAREASEIIKANLQFKHKDLSQQEIERIFNRQYAMPPKPQQGIDQTDDEYAVVLEDWKAKVAEKEQDMIIDAKLAKPELAQYKSQLVLPDIPKVEPQAQGPKPEELAAQEAFRNNFVQHLERDYTKFTGFNVTAKDGEVELPINYVVTPEEQAQSKQLIHDLNVNEFLDKRWFDEKGNPNISLMQSDLYLLNNRDKIFQKIANEAATKRLQHHLKTKSNVVVEGQSPNATVHTEKSVRELEEKTIWEA